LDLALAQGYSRKIRFKLLAHAQRQVNRRLKKNLWAY
jgi:hypothetical protein